MTERPTPAIGAAEVRRGGLLLLDKPSGMTSFDMVNRVRRALVTDLPELARGRDRRGGHRPPRFRVGHAGTLDPMATGLLLVMTGRASRLSPFLMGLDKVYAATVRFGAATDSHDADGAILGTAATPDTVDAVSAVLDRFRGEIAQVPPVISALKRDGLPLYKRARAGEDVAEPDPRPVTIHRLEVTDVRWSGEAPELDLEVACSSGTYVRSLARDIAQAAGTLGHLAALRRLSVGPFDVGEALACDASPSGLELAAGLRAPVAALPHVPHLALSADEAAAVRQGQQPEAAWLERLSGELVPDKKYGALVRMLDPRGDLVAVGRIDPADDLLKLAMVLGDDASAERDVPCD